MDIQPRDRPGGFRKDYFCSRQRSGGKVATARSTSPAAVAALIAAAVVTTVATVTTFISYNLPPVGAKWGKLTDHQQGDAQEHHGCESLHC
jgi:hypothetical protein